MLKELNEPYGFQLLKPATLWGVQVKISCRILRKRPMDIGQALKPLGRIDVSRLQSRVADLDRSAWLEQSIRQVDFRDVHGDTESVVLVFCNGDWPNMTVTKDKGWGRLAEDAVPVMHTIIAQHYPKGGTILRAMAAKLKAGGRIRTHVDSHTSFQRSHRVHIPLKTNSQVRFMIDGRPYKLDEGHAYEVNNQKPHGVMNTGKEDRINFIFDYCPA